MTTFVGAINCPRRAKGEGDVAIFTKTAWSVPCPLTVALAVNSAVSIEHVIPSTRELDACSVNESPWRSIVAIGWFPRILTRDHWIKANRELKCYSIVLPIKRKRMALNANN